MMKTLLLPSVFFFFSTLVQSQNIDSLAIAREIDSLINLSRQLLTNRQYDEAFAVIENAGQKTEVIFGKQGVHYASYLYNRARVIQYLGKLEEAELNFKDAMLLREKIFGKDHSEFVKCLYGLARLYQMTQRLTEAIQFYRQAFATLEKVDKADPLYIYIVRELGITYAETRDFEQAEPFFLETLKIEENTYGRESVNYAYALDNMGEFYRLVGQYEKSEQCRLDGMAILSNIQDKDSLHFAISLNGLAVLYYSMDHYEKSESSFLEALKIFEKIDEKEHFEQNYAKCLSGLALLYIKMGRYEKAEDNLLEILTIQSKIFGKVNQNYANTLAYLANVYYLRNNFEKAERLYLEALTIQDKTVGEKHTDYAFTLSSLAELYRYLKRYQEADSLFLKSLPVLKKALGREHLVYAHSRMFLAKLYGNMGRTEKAEKIFLELLPIIEKSIGKSSEKYGECLLELAMLYNNMGLYEKAKPVFREASQLYIKHLISASRFLSEKALSEFVSVFEDFFDCYLSFAQTTYQIYPNISTDLYNNALFRKGFLLLSVCRRNRLAASDSTATGLNNLQKSYLRLLAEQYALPIAERDSIQVSKWENKTDSLEKELVRRVEGFSEIVRQVSWQEVRATLLPGDMAIEFVRFRNYGKSDTGLLRYAALLLKPDAPQPLFIPLFEEKQLDSLLGHTTVRKTDYVNNLYAIADRGAKPLGKPQKTLYELIWQPLEKEMEGVKTIYFSPSGLLHRLNLGAIPVGEESLERPTLADRYRLVQLGSTRTIATSDVRNISNTPDTSNFKLQTSNYSILYGGIRYEMDSTALRRANTDLAARNISDSRGLSFAYADTANRGGNWAYLPWTEVEVKSVEKILQANGRSEALVRTGYTATEESFKQIGQSGHSPRILHVATHGFFFPDPAPQPPKGGARVDSPPLGGWGEGGVFRISEHPMIRSGLILAGANQVWKGGKPLANTEDGILTAYEISQMNLSNTELVVLSACETGLGDIQGNEGVYGLQRAFKIAGAKYLVMSLWQVPDRPTQEMMALFYENWLEQKSSIPDAFRVAQDEMRARYPDEPYKWAGFVLVE